MGRLVGDPSAAVIAGDVRANENLGLTAVQTLFVREHNRIVAALPDDLDEQTKFEIARRAVGAEQQWITFQEFLPAMGGALAVRGLRPCGRPQHHERVRHRWISSALTDPRRVRSVR
ncbi:MAG: peroxidase family protein [Ilumatobacteraceae bacterium]